MAIRILYVEDDVASGRLVKWIAEKEGYIVDVVTTGRESLKALSGAPPDLILTDLNLPDTSGLELLPKLREKLPEAPVIVVTASESIQDVITAMKRGAIDYLTKPIDLQRMIVSLANAVKMMRQQRLRTEVEEAHALEHLVG